ncbi:MAG TPA: hypothetical protein VJT49_31605 [Amycolatopsis sp.]|uniref:hypothetical protein n=1 Tax=Amycolatopsis sp. TaxID=37632 RepID=UPI002B48E95E|nr:hypothetical protein [Amycolatopsis sp.]HKS49578.1 hypothetical protein [Amycolatopsis sp.]
MAHRSPVRAMAGRLSWGLADQAVSSLTNFAVGSYVARSLGATAFGIFSLALVTYGVALNVSRGLATDPLMVRFSGAPFDRWRLAVARASGTALGVGAAAGAVCLLLGVALGGALGHGFVGLGVVLPALLLQDSWRYAFFADGKGRKAFTNDLVWGLMLVPAMFVAARNGTVTGFVLAWGAAAAVAAGFGYFQTGIWPRVSSARRWLAEQRDLAPRYLLENVSTSGASQLRSYGLGGIAGLAAVGTVRGAELLLGPFLAVLMGLSLVTVAEASRVVQRAPHRLRQFCLLLGVGQAGAALLWGVALLLLPDVAGEFVLGKVWITASTLIVPATLSVVGASFTTGAQAGLRALGAAKRSMPTQLVTSSFYVTGGLVGAVVDGALGSAIGVAAANVIGATVWWFQLQSGIKEIK